ncbi:MAG: hypothetical protein KDA37_09695, partial [Planctomycetales bacterium]|nr:hypothetical protein [Planctomycetales bacterium]
MFEVACAVGSMALMAYPIEPSLVLDEFRPSLWTRCSSGRLQLGVRIIFPFAEHPVTQGRLNTIVWGETYSETGHWQRLQVAGLEKQLSSELVSLRQRFGGELNLEGAYIDALVLNAYTGPGRYRVQVDDLNLNGLIPLTATGGSLPANWREKWRWRYEVFKPSAEQRFWVSPNRPPTWLHYRGESLPWVRSIGFAGLILNELPSEQQLGRIREAELGAISPPPTHNVAFDATAAQALKGWSIGSALDARQSEVARRQVQRVTQLPSELRRPLVGEALEHYWMFSRIADEVILPFPAPLTAGQTAEKIAWAAQNLETTKKRGDGWVSLDVGPNPALVDQLRAAHAIIAPQREFDAVQANPLGLRYQAACAAVAGARGLVFRTFKPLDLQAPGDSATVAALRWIHSDLALWGPWMVSGQTSAAPTLDRPDYTAAAWNVSHSRLVIALVSSPAAQHCLPSTGDQPLQLSLASSATPQQILRVTEGRLQRVEAQATPEGLQWRVERPVPVETFVITSNPLVIDYVRGQLSVGAEQRVADQLEIASYNMGLATQLVEARYPPLEESLFADGDDPLGIRATLRNLAIAQRQLDQGYQAMHSRQAMGAFTLAARA